MRTGWNIHSYAKSLITWASIPKCSNITEILQLVNHWCNDHLYPPIKSTVCKNEHCGTWLCPLVLWNPSFFDDNSQRLKAFHTNTPTVQQIVKTQFDCPEATGALLENEPTNTADCFGIKSHHRTKSLRLPHEPSHKHNNDNRGLLIWRRKVTEEDKEGIVHPFWYAAIRPADGIVATDLISFGR